MAFSQGKFPKKLAYLPGTAAYRSAWRETIKAADEANDPGRFTAFIGYEWTSNTGGNNLHRNVIFRDNGAKASLVEPYTTRSRWAATIPATCGSGWPTTEEKTGGEVLAIAHNGNLSNGRMFPIIESFTGKTIDRDYAENRMRWEPLYEATQIKGDGETHPFLSPNDEFANFETLGQGQPGPERSQEAGDAGVRVCPFGAEERPQAGAGTRRQSLQVRHGRHRPMRTPRLAAVEEDNFFGKHFRIRAERDPGHASLHQDAERRGHHGLGNDRLRLRRRLGDRRTRARRIFDAMKRRETYATTGPRMVVRFFGGWDFEAKDAHNRMPAQIGYTKGVPMGGDLTDAPAGKAPTFLVAALKDPIGANLDRYQIIKGWLDAKGDSPREDLRRGRGPATASPARTASCPPVGNTVDVANATWTNTIGAPELIAVWKDPDFDPAQRAFYYGRVIEIPTPRWTAYDAK